MTPRLRALVAEYNDSHRTPANRVLHLYGIPALATAALGLLGRAAVRVETGAGSVTGNAAWPALATAAGWYVWADRRTGPRVLALLAACYAAGRRVPTRGLIGLGASGVAAHLAGHFAFEGKPPAFFSDPMSVFKGPAWLLWLVTRTGPEHPAGPPAPGDAAAARPGGRAAAPGW